MPVKAPYKRYNGGKSGSGTYQAIINCIPPIVNYIEPFLGNGGVVRHMAPVDGFCILNDLNPDVAGAWKEWISNYGSEWGTAFLLNQDGLLLIDQVSKNTNFDLSKTLIYCDPPYRFGSRRSPKLLYGEYEWNDQQHLEFLEVAVTAKCMVAISHYPDAEFYDEILINKNGWHHMDYQSITSQGMATERLYFNYPKPVILHDYRHAGDDYRDREEIKRKRNRWNTKFKRLPAIQQAVILKDLITSNIDLVKQIIPQHYDTSKSTQVSEGANRTI